MSDQAAAPAQAAPTTQTPAQDPRLVTTDAKKPSGLNTGAATGAPETMTKEEARAEIRKHKLKVDGQEVEVDEEELKRGYSHQKAANKILQEGKAAKKQAEEFISMMKDKGKLFDAIKKLGHDPRKLSEEFLMSQLEEELLDPRERELKTVSQKLKHYEDLEKKQQEEVIKRRDAALKQKYAEEYSGKFIKALADVGFAELTITQQKDCIGAMAKYIHRAAEMKFEMTADEAAKLVREDIEQRSNMFTREADGATLARLLGDQGLQKVRAYEVARLKSPESNLKTPTEQGEPQSRARSSGKRMTPQEWREFNRR